MRLVVDGMNVIGSRPTGWWRDRPGAMRDLTGELVAYAEATGDRVIVIFDGATFDLDGSDRVEVRFATRSGQNAADDDIAALVEADDDPAGLTIVTSDAGLAARVRSAGGAVTGAGAFRQRLEEGGA